MIAVLLLTLATQAPVDETPPPPAPPIEETTPPAEPPPVVPPAETPPIVIEEPPATPPIEEPPLTPAPATVPPTDTPPPETTTTTPPPPLPELELEPAPDFFAHDRPGHYLAWYGAEYAAIAIIAGLYAGGVNDAIPSAPALIGPRFDLDKPDVQVLFDPRLDDVIGRPYLKEKVSEGALIGGAAVVLLGVAGADFLATNDLHRTHGLVLGGAEAVFGTLVVTEVFKLSFGRLRPDFRERWLRGACAGNVEAPDGLDCSSVDDGFELSKDEVQYGMESFISGHASSSFAVATFASMWIGSSLVWNDERPDWGPAVGALVAGSLYTTAGLVAASRISDNRHHPEDVVVGAAVGATIGATMFLIHFDVDGDARRRSWTVVPTTGLGASGTGNGVAMVGTF
ncbi:MAG: phosphatase PAP2 family protein [Deltaproteobacteria bacterium]|nr:phosphatase PAP2 family protein [Deltaproteobacteria bacterium]